MINKYTDVLEKHIEDIKIPLIISLALNDKIADKLNEIYTKNETRYRKISTDEYEAGALFYVNLYSVKYAKRIHQANSIVTNVFNNQSYEDLLPLLKSGYNRLYRYIEQTKIVDRDLLYQQYILQLGNITNEEVGMIFASAFYISVLKGKLKDDSIMEIIEAWNMSMKGKYDEAQKKSQKPDLQELASLEKANEAYKEIKNRFLIKGKFNLKTFNSHVITRAFDAETDAQKKRLSSKSLTNNILNKALENIMAAGEEAAFSDFLDTISTTFGFSNLKEVHEFTDVESDRYIYEVCHAIQKYNLTNTYSIESILIATNKILQIIKEYESAIDLYTETLTQDIEARIKDQFKNELHAFYEKQQQQAKEIAEYKKKLAIQQMQQKEAKKLLTDQGKELKELRQMKDSYIRMQKEVVSLRNYSYNIGEKIVEATPVPKELALNDMIEYLNERNIVIVGGNSNWQNRIKEILPHINFISIDKTGSFKMLEKEGIIAVINTLTNSHKNYHLLLKHLHPNNDLLYFNAHVNIDLSISTLYEIVKSAKNI